MAKILVGDGENYFEKKVQLEFAAEGGSLFYPSVFEIS